MNGVVKRLVRDRGFGFIRTIDGKEYFFHRSSCPFEYDTMNEGARVSFVEEQSTKGLRAGNVTLLHDRD